MGGLIFRQMGLKQEVNGFFTVVRSEIENVNYSVDYLNGGSTDSQP